MAYTVQQAQANFPRLIQESREGKEVEISRPGKPSIHLTLISRSPRKPRIPGEYAGMSHYSDGIFKPLETNEELRETALTFWRTQK